MKYVRVCKGTNDKGRFHPADEDIVTNVIKDFDTDWYASVFHYSEEQKKQAQQVDSVAGITDLTTNKLVWDFDSESNIEFAKADAISLCSRLVSYGIPQDSIRICFSGSKGFYVEIETDKTFTPEEYRNINIELAKGLATNDTKVLNAGRLFRVPFTKHQKSGLYKYPLTFLQLVNLSTSDIKTLAKTNQIDDPSSIRQFKVELSDNIYNLRIKTDIEKKLSLKEAALDLDFHHKPKFLTNCKFALLHGYFKEGNRSHALIALAATFKNQGFPKEVTYRMLKGAAELAAECSGGDVYPKDEIWNNVINQVYSPRWKGGQYSCKSDIWLKEICESLGPHRCKGTEQEYLHVSDMGSLFKKYASTIESNLIKTGIKSLDENVEISIGTSIGILGSPGSGKTSLSLNILNNTSKQGIKSAFFSLDMYHVLVLQKMLQKHTGMNGKQLYELAKNDNEYIRILKELEEEYKNVGVYYKSGYTVEDMKNLVIDQQERTGDKVKLVVVDYLECIQGPYSDSNANTAIIANQLKDMANELETCVMTLVQPQKSAGDASRPLHSMRQVKGASTLEQAFSIIFGIYREGFNPNRTDRDWFITINTLKNRMGASFKDDYRWSGLKGEITELAYEEKAEIETLRREIAAERAAQMSTIEDLL